MVSGESKTFLRSGGKHFHGFEKVPEARNGNFEEKGKEKGRKREGEGDE